MLRYYAAATAIVLVFAVVAAAYFNRDRLRIKLASVYAPVTPKPAPPNPNRTAPPGAFRGTVPWALSALPECFMPTKIIHGARPFVLARLPASAVAIRPPATLHYADCTVRIVGDQAFVARGADRFHIPPHARFYRGRGGSLLLLHWTRRGAILWSYLPARAHL